MDLGRITGAGIDYFMDLTLEELYEVAEEVADEVVKNGRKK
ncbi:hypothetical protein [Anaerotignum propionicum]|nr:hypothetical protein [Anaerotignum propionicum]